MSPKPPPVTMLGVKFSSSEARDRVRHITLSVQTTSAFSIKQQYLNITLFSQLSLRIQTFFILLRVLLRKN